jgi:hypothetical protein
MSTELLQIEYVSPLDDVDPENDNIDVHVRLDDGRSVQLSDCNPEQHL